MHDRRPGRGHRGVDRHGGVDVVLGEDGEQEEEGHHEDRDDGVEDLDRDALVELLGHLLGPAPVAEDGAQDEQDDEAADDDAGGHHPRVELEGVLALGGGTPAGAVGRVEVAPAEDQRCGEARPTAGRVQRRRRGRRRPGTGSVGRRVACGQGRRRSVCEGVHGDDTSGDRAAKSEVQTDPCSATRTPSVRGVATTGRRGLGPSPVAGRLGLPGGPGEDAVAMVEVAASARRVKTVRGPRCTAGSSGAASQASSARCPARRRASASVRAGVSAGPSPGRASSPGPGRPGRRRRRRARPAPAPAPARGPA